MTGNEFAMKCMALADSPEKWWGWVRKTAYYTVPFSFMVQIVFMCFVWVVSFVGAGLIGAFWTFPQSLRRYYGDEK